MKSIVITGVSSGLGFESARSFIESGYTVFGSLRKQEDAARVHQALGKNFIPLIFDIRNHSDIDIAANIVRAKLNGNILAGLINNAGSAEICPLLHVDPDSFRDQFEVLVLGPLVVTQRFSPMLYSADDSKPSGRIINISSISGIEAYPPFGCYATFKHALEGLSKSLRKEFKRYGVKVIVVGPGNIKTEIWNKFTVKQIEKYKHTDFYPDLISTIGYINTTVVNESMDVSKYSKILKNIFESTNPRDRYEIV